MARPSAIATQVARTTSRRQSRSASSRSSALDGVRGGRSSFSKEALRRLAGAWTMGLCSAARLNCSDEGERRRAGGLSILVLFLLAARVRRGGARALLGFVHARSGVVPSSAIDASYGNA